MMLLNFLVSRLEFYRRLLTVAIAAVTSIIVNIIFKMLE
jgi:hypothetical protein